LVVAAHAGTDYQLICCRGTCPGQPRNATTGEARVRSSFDASAPAPARSSEPSAAAADDTRLLYAPLADPYDQHNLAPSLPAVVAALAPMLPAGWCGAG
jgi:hypothetical protein